MERPSDPSGSIFLPTTPKHWQEQPRALPLPASFSCPHRPPWPGVSAHHSAPRLPSGPSLTPSPGWVCAPLLGPPGNLPLGCHCFPTTTEKEQ